MSAMVRSVGALLIVLVLGCGEGRRDDAAARIESTADQAAAEVREGARDVGNAAERAAETATEDAPDYSWEGREEFRRDVSERLDNLDEEISVVADNVGESADQARKDALAGVHSARRAVDRRVERLSAATAANWEERKGDVNAALDSLVRKIRALQPDAKPMGGTGGPN